MRYALPVFACCLLALPSAPALASPGTSGPEVSTAQHLADGIETVGFVNLPNLGSSGIVDTSPVPVVLFEGGAALKAMSALGHPEGLEAHRLAFPEQWTEWQKSGSDILVKDPQGQWKKLAYAKTMDPLPAGAALDGTFTRMSGAGTAATAATALLPSWDSLNFGRDGTFTVGAAAARAGRGNENVLSGNGGRAESGKYDIEGYTISLHYADGREEKRFVVTDLADPEAAVWIDGVGYERAKED